MENNSYSIMLAKLQAHRQTEAIIKSALDPFDVTTREWLLLGSLKNHDNCTEPGVIAGELYISLALITRLTKALEIKGLVHVSQPEDDKRRRLIKLTSKGVNVLHLSEPKVKQTLKEWLSPIDRKHVETYMEVLLQVAYKL